MNICRLGLQKENSVKQEKDAYWQDLIKAQQLSGLSQKQFCAQEGISYRSFTNRASRLKEESLSSGPGSFVSAVVTSDSMPLNTKKRMPKPTVETSVGFPPKDLEIRLGGLVVVVPSGFDEDTLRRLMGIIHV